MADEPELYLQVIGFEGLHGVKEPGRQVSHFTWNPDISFEPDYLAMDPKLRLIVRELIDMQAEGGGVVEYKLKSMRRRWHCKAEKYLAVLIVGGVVKVVDRRGREATPLLEISRTYNPRIRNKNKNAKAGAPKAPRTALKEGTEQRRKNQVLECVRDAAANDRMDYAYQQCSRDSEIGTSNITETEFLEAWNGIISDEQDDEAIKAWQPRGGSA